MSKVHTGDLKKGTRLYIIESELQLFTRVSVAFVDLKLFYVNCTMYLRILNVLSVILCSCEITSLLSLHG